MLPLTEKSKKKILGPLYSEEIVEVFDEYFERLEIKLKDKKNFASRLRSNLTEAEARVWAKLNNSKLMKRNGMKFRQQAPKFGYILDFYCPHSLICIEIDGEYHNESKQQINDTIRDYNLDKLGIKTFRMTNLTTESPSALSQRLQEVAILGKLRIQAFKDQGIKQPNVLMEQRGLRMGFIKYLETKKIYTARDKVFLF